jgi:predicted nucleotidyltransferase
MKSYSRENILVEIISFVGVLVVVAMIANNISEDKEYNKKLQSGEIRIECNILGDGLVLIEPSKIVDFDIDTNTVTFTNGSAKSCEVVK